MKLLCLLPQLFDLSLGYIERFGLELDTPPVGCIPRLDSLLDVQEILLPFMLTVVVRTKERHEPSHRRLVILLARTDCLIIHQWVAVRCDHVAV